MKRLVLSVCVFAVACGSDAANNGADVGDECQGARCATDTGMSPNNMAGADMGGEDDPDTGGVSDMGTDDLGDVNNPPKGPRCDWMAPAEDRARKVVVAKYSLAGEPSLDVFDLSAAGDLSLTGDTFTLRGRSTSGTIQFTRDGQYGYVAQEFNLEAGGNDRTIGIFRVSSNGSVEVVNADFDPGFYVSRIAMDPDGETLWGWEGGFREVGGALYRMELDCATGVPGPAELVTQAKLVKGIGFVGDDRAVVAATDLFDDLTPNDLHLVDLTDLSLLSSVGVYPNDVDDEAIIDSMVVTRDGKYAIASNAGLFATHEIGIAAVEGDTLRFVQNILLDDPSAMATSPYNNAAIVLGVEANAINLLSYDPDNATTPFSLVGPAPTSTSTPLPGSLATIDAGSLAGAVVVSENVAVRVLQFQPDGSMSELSLWDPGPNAGAISGAIGVQP